MSLLSTLKFIVNHPLNSGRPLQAISRFSWWQIESRLRSEVVVDWVGGSKLVVRRGMTGATGNIYCGLHEYVDMAFLLHLLRPGDLFVDIGANVGSYTVLASSVRRANTIAVEPDPETVAALTRNVGINKIEDLVRIDETALGANEGFTKFTIGMDTTNQIADDDMQNTRTVRLTTLDTLIGDQSPMLIKMDVEGFEDQVLVGAMQTLASQNLLGIITEDTGAVVNDLLESNGFTRWYYDPSDRNLNKWRSRHGSNNGIYIRSKEECTERLMSSPRYRITHIEI